jgi:hypothetical protein
MSRYPRGRHRDERTRPPRTFRDTAVQLTPTILGMALVVAAGLATALLRHERAGRGTTFIG